MTDVTSATLEATLAAAVRSVESARGESMPTRMAIVAMGRYGGFELGYGSDADVMFVHDPLPGADPQLAGSMAQAVANDVRRLLSAHGKDPALDVDADLRPEGRQGPLVRTFDSYAAYYGKWSEVWEAQALLRAAPSWATSTCAAVHGADRPAAVHRAGPDRRRRRGGTADQGAGRRRTAAARRRPDDPPQARPGRPLRHRVDRAAAADAGTPGGSRSCAPPRPWRRCGRRRARPDRTSPTRTPSPRRGGSPAGPATPPSRCGASPRTAAPRRPRTSRGGAVLQYPPGESDAMSTTTCAWPGGLAAIVDRVFWQ